MCLLLSTVQADLIGLWRFDEGDGNDVSDSSGYGNDGGLWASDAHKGLENGVEVNNVEPRWITHSGYGTALEFGTLPGGGLPNDGNTNWNYVYVPHSPELANLGGKWSIAFWVNHKHNYSVNVFNLNQREELP